MLIIFGPLLFAVFLNAMGSRAEEVQQVITCQAGSYFKGETASVTCNFHKDMNLDKRSISVARYLTIATTDATARETVLACQWKEEWTCEPKSNFIVRGVINNLLTVEVPAVTADNAGVYICFVIPAKETVSHHCNLSIKADAGMSTPYTTPGVLPSNDTHLSQETEKDESSHVLKIALPIVVVVIGLPVTGILCFCLYKHRSARNVRRTPPEDGQQNYTPEELSPLTGASEMNGGGSGVGRTAPSKCTPYEQPTVNMAAQPDLAMCNQRVQQWYPELSTQSYFVPAVYMNRTQHD
ncbi:uncharacterized protein, partial [Littorina saxatilis]|uniref:uncharacterized protein n=1 Tax=Littorina saxatilis TaxID=31220 RepID=UPI0038B48F9D